MKNEQNRNPKRLRIFIFTGITVLTCLLWQCGSPIDPQINTQSETVTETTSLIENPIYSETPSPIRTSTSIISVTPSPIPSRTQIPITETPTITPVETELALPTPTIMKSPRYSSDLLYISDKNLMRWDHVTGTVRVESDNVDEYSIDSSGTFAAVLKSRNIVANGVQLYDLELMDLRSVDIIPISTSIPKIYNLHLSPDNSWILYTSNYNGGKITAIHTSDQQSVIDLGFCHQLLNTPCNNISWSPDSEQVIWSDQRGVWINELLGENPRLITQNRAKISGPGGETTEIEVNYTDFSWSPSGRFVLSTINPTTYQTWWSVIIDSRREAIFDIPQSIQTQGHSGNTAWLQDGSIVVGSSIHQSDNSSYPVIIQIFDIVPTQENLLQLSGSFGITGDQLPNPILMTDTPQYLVDWIHQYSENQLNFGVYIAGDNSPKNLYSLMMDKYFINFIRHTPTTTSQVMWALDESGKLIIDSDGSVFFAGMDGESITQLNQILGSELNYFTWLPPAPR